MPYIPEIDRPRIDVIVKHLFINDHKMTAGEANYSITRILWRFMCQDGKPRYINFCIAVGTLVCVLLELYRRKAAPYEDEKIKENGDVYRD